MTPAPFARVQLLSDPIPVAAVERLPVGDATEHKPLAVIGDPGRDGLDIEDLATALMDLDGWEGA